MPCGLKRLATAAALGGQALAKAHDSLAEYRVIAQIDREDGGVVAAAGRREAPVPLLARPGRATGSALRLGGTRSAACALLAPRAPPSIAPR